MILFLVGCGEERPRGLRLITIQEKQVANIPRITILDFDEDPPKRIELSDGESKDGIELVEVDFAKRSALIRRNGEEVRLVMNGAEQDGAGQPATRPESDSEEGDKPQPESE